MTEATIQTTPGPDEIILGNPVKLTCTFLNEASQPTSPSTVVLRILPPQQKPREEPAAINEGVGIFVYTFVPGLPGKWEVRFAGTAGLIAAVEGVFTVKNSNLI